MSLASSWYELTKDTVPMKTTLSVTFSCLTPCSNLVNCFNHRELIPVMPLPPLPRVVSGRCIVPLALIHPEYQPSPTIFRSPDPSSYLSVSTLKIGQSFVCAHTLAATLWLMYFHNHKWQRQTFSKQWPTDVPFW